MPDYYLQVFSNGEEVFWLVDGATAHRNMSPSQLGTHYAEPGEDIFATLRKRFPPSQFYKLELAPGEYFPRMARPNSTKQECSPGENPDRSSTAKISRTISTGQLHVLIQELQQICRVVHPIDANLVAYGHEIRNILIIACTEVEAHWKNIMEANGEKACSRLDYVKLSPAMKLSEYRVVLPWYPWLAPISPFEKWMPTPKGVKQDLPWYDAYNSVKHDRENAFAEATLINALTSVTGCFVMLCAQYGWDFARRGEAAADAFFQLVKTPVWSPSEIYIPLGGGDYKERHYSFPPNRDRCSSVPSVSPW